MCCWFSSIEFSFCSLYMQIYLLNVCKLNWERKPFWFLCRINSFQNQNAYKRNFKLIINNSHMFYSNIRNGNMSLVVTWQLLYSKNVLSKFWFAWAFFFALLNALHICGYVHLWWHVSAESACFINRRILFQLIDRSLFLNLVTI